jgi:hypothetical protein
MRLVKMFTTFCGNANDIPKFNQGFKVVVQETVKCYCKSGFWHTQRAVQKMQFLTPPPSLCNCFRFPGKQLLGKQHKETEKPAIEKNKKKCKNVNMKRATPFSDYNPAEEKE